VPDHDHENDRFVTIKASMEALSCVTTMAMAMAALRPDEARKVLAMSDLKSLMEPKNYEDGTPEETALYNDEFHEAIERFMNRAKDQLGKLDDLVCGAS